MDGAGSLDDFLIRYWVINCSNLFEAQQRTAELLCQVSQYIDKSLFVQSFARFLGVIPVDTDGEPPAGKQVALSTEYGPEACRVYVLGLRWMAWKSGGASATHEAPMITLELASQFSEEALVTQVLMVPDISEWKRKLRQWIVTRLKDGQTMDRDRFLKEVSESWGKCVREHVTNRISDARLPPISQLKSLALPAFTALVRNIHPAACLVYKEPEFAAIARAVILAGRTQSWTDALLGVLRSRNFFLINWQHFDTIRSRPSTATYGAAAAASPSPPASVSFDLMADSSSFSFSSSSS